MKVTVERSGRWWVATFAHGSTQAKRLADLPANVVEVVELMTGEVVNPASVDLVLRETA